MFALPVEGHSDFSAVWLLRCTFYFISTSIT